MMCIWFYSSYQYIKIIRIIINIKAEVIVPHFNETLQFSYNSGCAWNEVLNLLFFKIRWGQNNFPMFKIPRWLIIFEIYQYLLLSKKDKKLLAGEPSAAPCKIIFYV